MRSPTFGTKYRSRNGMATLRWRPARPNPIRSPSRCPACAPGDATRQRCGRRGVGRRSRLVPAGCPRDATGPAFLVGDSIVYSPKAGGCRGSPSEWSDRNAASNRLLAGRGHVRQRAVLLVLRHHRRRHRVAVLARTSWRHVHRGHSGGDLNHTSWHLGRDAIVGTGSYYSGMAPDIYDLAGNHLAAESEAAGPANRDPLTGNRMIYTMNAAGLWGSMEGDTLTLRQWGSTDDPDRPGSTRKTMKGPGTEVPGPFTRIGSEVFHACRRPCRRRSPSPACRPRRPRW